MCLAKEDEIVKLDLLEVLQKYTDKNNGKSQKEIITILQNDYGYKNLYERRWTVKDNLIKLIDYHNEKYGYQKKITYKESSRNVPVKPKKGEQETNKKTTKVVYIRSDFKYIHDFADEELRLMIDSLLFSKQIPSDQREALIKKLAGLTSKKFDSRTKYITAQSSNVPMNRELFDNIKVLDKAINTAKKVSFYYTTHVVEGFPYAKMKLQARKNNQGQIREYIIKPYQMVATNGRYYLICNNDAYHNLTHFRLDRITDIEILEDEDRKPLQKIADVDNRFDLQQYMREHIYMFAGESENVTLRIKKGALGEFVDWFGTENISFTGQTEVDYTVRVKVNVNAMRKWALQYGLHVKVLSPDDLVKAIKEVIAQVMKNYE